MSNDGKVLSKNDYLVLTKLLENNCTTEMKSWTIKFIAENLNLSQSKIRKTVLTFQNLNYLQQGAMQYNAKTYFITQKGIDKLKELKVI